MKTKTLLFAATLCCSCSCTTVRQLRAHDTLPVDGKAEKTRTKDALDYSIATRIAATPEQVWAVLTDCPAYPTWNTTVVKLEGTCALGGEIHLVVTDAKDRTFDLKVSTFDAPKKMVWEDGGAMFLGVRNFTLTPDGDGTRFAMSETLSGAMLGMIEGKLPDFTKSFETFAADLKAKVESQKSH